MTNSIKKGKSFERDIANLLTKTLNRKFVRVPQSGAMATNNLLENMQGDVIELDVIEGKKKQDLVIECKAYKEFNLNELFHIKSKLYRFINQCEKEGVNKYWYLFIKANNKGTYILKKKDQKETEIDILIKDKFIIYLQDFLLVKIR